MVPRLNNINSLDNNINQNSNDMNSNQNTRNVINANNSNSNILNHNNIQLNILSDNTNNFFIILFNPNKAICFIILFLNIIVSGLGTILIAFKNCSLYDFLLGILQFFGCYYCFFKGIESKKYYNILYFRTNSLLSIYFIIIAILMYLSSIYAGIFHNFIFFNQRRIKINENKEKGICILFFNLLTGGVGTLLYGFLMQNIDFFYRIRIWFTGIVQIGGFIILILAFSLIGKINKTILIILFIVGIMGYITSICI